MWPAARIVLLMIIVLLGGCTFKSGSYSYGGKPSQKYPSSQLVSDSSSIYKSNGDLQATMRPYTVMGREYYPTVVKVGDRFDGIASWYGSDFHGKTTSNGEGYDMYSFTAAHKTLPMNTVVRVTNLENGAETIVRINDRGPFVENRIIDLSYAAAYKIDLPRKGTASVKLEVLGFEPSGSRSIDMRMIANGPKQEVLGGFYVQIGAFERYEGALYTKRQYASYEAYSAIVKETEYNNKRLYRVWLSGFKSEAEARDFIARKRGDFPGTFITRD